MSNMSYCRFENTFNDLYDAASALDEKTPEEIIKNATSEFEADSVIEVIELCKKIADKYGDERNIRKLKRLLKERTYCDETN